MQPTRLSGMSRFATALVVASACVCHHVAAQDRPPDVQAGIEVQTRGPVHEAFAEVVMFNPEPGPVVAKAPPPAIEEIPPDQKPEGSNITWIPGYWAWDDERSDFLWVSGVWRALPPGRSWVAGYWAQNGPGYQWMSGYWADARVAETTYLPEPPTSIEAGPNVLAPSPEHIWAPGCWIWFQDRYVWRPGYWVPAHSGWVWVPSHYTYCPRGYVYCEGYWDYAVESRGVLFAPVYFDAVVYRRPAFRFSPFFVISLSVFSDDLFVRPSCHHYYFGDYYERRYYDAGIYAAFSFSHTRFGYDPIYMSQRYQHRDAPDWDHQVRQTFLYRRDHEEARPPRTFAAQSAPGRAAVGPGERTPEIATPFDRAAASKDHPIKLQRVAPEEKQAVANRGRDVESFRNQRSTLESPSARTPQPQAPRSQERTSPRPPPLKPPSRPESDPEVYRPSARPDRAAKPDGAPAGIPVRAPAPDKAKMPQSPIRAPEQVDKAKAPPSRPEPPRPDPKVQPGPRPNDHGRPDAPQANPKDDSERSVNRILPGPA